MKLIGYVEFIFERSKVYAMRTNTYRKLFKREEYGLLILKGNHEFLMGWHSDEYQSTTPEGMDKEKRVQLHFIENGAHGFSKKHDRIAFEYIRDFIKMEI